MKTKLTDTQRFLLVERYSNRIADLVLNSDEHTVSDIQGMAQAIVLSMISEVEQQDKK